MKHDPNHNAYLPGEEWRPYAGYYEVSNLGRVRHVRVLEPRITKKPKNRWRGAGYASVTLFVNRVRMVRMVHRMVLEAFDRPRRDGEICRHLDGDPLNNRLNNLVWGTYQENADDRQRHGTTPRGVMLGQSKLTPEKVREIRVMADAGDLTQTAIASLFGVNQGTVSDVIHGKTWSWIK